MRFTLAALASERLTPSSYSVPVTVQLRPAGGVAGEHLYTTDSRALLSLLKHETKLASYAIDAFRMQLGSNSSARLSGVEFSDRTLREIGYFID